MNEQGAEPGKQPDKDKQGAEPGKQADKAKQGAEPGKQPDKDEEKRIEAEVVTQYGRHAPGNKVRVTEREYRRVGHGVLLTAEDKESLRREADAERNAALRQRREESGADSAPGWEEHGQEALRVVRERYLREQVRQREVLVGRE